MSLYIKFILKTTKVFKGSNDVQSTNIYENKAIGATACWARELINYCGRVF